jgi:hypothetical protein
MGFKENELFICLTFLAKPPWGWSRSDHKDSDIPTPRRESGRKTVTDGQLMPNSRYKPFQPDNYVDVSLTRPPASEQIGRRAHPHARTSRLMATHEIHAIRRCVTHQTARKRTEWEEGTPTCTKHMNEPRVPNTITKRQRLPCPNDKMSRSM